MYFLKINQTIHIIPAKIIRYEQKYWLSMSFEQVSKICTYVYSTYINHATFHQKREKSSLLNLIIRLKVSSFKYSKLVFELDSLSSYFPKF